MDKKEFLEEIRKSREHFEKAKKIITNNYDEEEKIYAEKIQQDDQNYHKSKNRTDLLQNFMFWYMDKHSLLNIKQFRNVQVTMYDLLNMISDMMISLKFIGVTLKEIREKSDTQIKDIEGKFSTFEETISKHSNKLHKTLENIEKDREEEKKQQDKQQKDEKKKLEELSGGMYG